MKHSSAPAREDLRPEDGRIGAPEVSGVEENDHRRSLNLPVDATVVALCVSHQHPVWKGRVRVRWEGAGEGEAWVLTLRGQVVREGDRVLLSFPANSPEPVVCGVLDGLRRRGEPEALTAAVLTLRPDESIRIDSEEGGPLLEVSRRPEGPVVRLLEGDILLSTDGRFALRAGTIDLEARDGGVRIQAEEDVVVRGEIVRLN